MHLDFRCTIVNSKTCVKWLLSKRLKIGFQEEIILNAGKKYCRMLQGEHSAILLTFIKLPFVIKIFVLSIFEWPFYTGFTVEGHFSPFNGYQQLGNFDHCIFIVEKMKF